jgi:hypothetical protein
MAQLFLSNLAELKTEERRYFDELASPHFVSNWSVLRDDMIPLLSRSCVDPRITAEYNLSRMFFSKAEQLMTFSLDMIRTLLLSRPLARRLEHTKRISVSPFYVPELDDDNIFHYPIWCVYQDSIYRLRFNPVREDYFLQSLLTFDRSERIYFHLHSDETEITQEQINLYNMEVCVNNF